jgi:hypothetical protein
MMLITELAGRAGMHCQDQPINDPKEARGSHGFMD